MPDSEDAARFDDATSLSERVEALERSLSPTEHRVARFLRDNPEHMIFLSAQRIAERTRTSDATVVRTAKTLGYSGLSELKQRVGKEVSGRTHPATRLDTRLQAAQQDSEHDLLRQVSRDAVERIEQTLGSVDAATLDAAVDVVFTAGCTFTFGTGVSSAAAEYAAKKFSRLGLHTRHIAGMGFDIADELMQLREGDCVVIFCPGRLFREIEVILDRSELLGVRTVLVTSGLPPEVRERMDVIADVASSPGGLTGELFSSLVVIDAMLLGLGARDRERATESSRLLNETRRLIDSRNGGRRRYG